MKRAWQIACLAFLVLAGLTLILARRYAYSDRLGPGPGFFPLWLSVVTGVLALGLLVQTALGRAATAGETPLVPDRLGGWRILVTLAALVGAVSVLEPLGFRLSLFLFLFLLPLALGARRWWLTLAFALAGSFGVYHVFYHWLKVPLPLGGLGL